MSLLQLLPELQEEIYSYCDDSDLRTLACCSSAYNNALKYLLWKTVNIPWGTIISKIPSRYFGKKSLLQKRLESLRYTTFLSFREKGVRAWEENIYPSHLPSKVEKTWNCISANFKQILQYCNPSVLVRLHIEGITVGGAILSHLSKQTQLRHLTVSYCLYSYMDVCLHTFKEFGNLHSLEELDLKYTYTNDAVLSHLCEKLTGLKILNIRGCTSVTDRGLDLLVKLKLLEELDVSGCFYITDGGFVHIGSLSMLTKLNVSHCCHVTDECVSHFSTLTSLNELDLSWCNRVADKKLSDISNFILLTKIDISRCTNVTDIGMAYISCVTSLEEVILNACLGITDKGLRKLSGLVNLKKLDIGFTNITQEGVKNLSKLRFLIQLDITGCFNVSDDGIRYLTTFVLLRKLNISRSMLTDAGVSHLQSLTFLKELNIGIPW